MILRKGAAWADPSDTAGCPWSCPEEEEAGVGASWGETLLGASQDRS